jgi:hypothetical protein
MGIFWFLFFVGFFFFFFFNSFVSSSSPCPLSLSLPTHTPLLTSLPFFYLCLAFFCFFFRVSLIERRRPTFGVWKKVLFELVSAVLKAKLSLPHFLNFIQHPDLVRSPSSFFFFFFTFSFCSLRNHQPSNLFRSQRFSSMSSG